MIKILIKDGGRIIFLPVLIFLLCGQAQAQAPVNCSEKMFPGRCFDDHFKKCSPAQMSAKFLVEYHLEILGPTPDGNLCEVKSSYVDHPNPDIGNKEMICQYDNTRRFRDVQQDTSRCRGPLYDDLFKNTIDISSGDMNQLKQGLKDIFSGVNITVSTDNSPGITFNSSGIVRQPSSLNQGSLDSPLTSRQSLSTGGDPGTVIKTPIRRTRLSPLDAGPFDPKKMMSDQSCQSVQDCDREDYPFCYKQKCIHLNEKMRAYITQETPDCHLHCFLCRSGRYIRLNQSNNFRSFDYCVECIEDNHCIDDYYCDKGICRPNDAWGDSSS